MPMPKIDYNLLGKALCAYEQRGYRYVEVPWIVPKSLIRTTLPAPTPFIEAVLHQDDDDDMSHTSYSSLGGLVGSAEQALVGMELDPGLYCAITPCFRHEQATGFFYQTGFMKLELFANGPSDDYDMLMKDARDIMGRHTDHFVEVVETDDGHDLHLGGIEIGSYGNRYYEGLGPWAYGTGLALPRFSVARALAATV